MAKFYWGLHDRDGNVLVKQRVVGAMPDAATYQLREYHLPIGRVPNTVPFLERILDE